MPAETTTDVFVKVAFEDVKDGIASVRVAQVFQAMGIATEF